MVGETRHMSFSVRGALLLSKREMEGVFRHDDGRLMTPDEARTELMDHLAAGHEKLPIGECEGFDFKTGCPGHRKEVTDDR